MANGGGVGRAHDGLNAARIDAHARARPERRSLLVQKVHKIDGVLLDSRHALILLREQKQVADDAAHALVLGTQILGELGRFDGLITQKA